MNKFINMQDMSKNVVVTPKLISERRNTGWDLLKDGAVILISPNKDFCDGADGFYK